MWYTVTTIDRFHCAWTRESLAAIDRWLHCTVTTIDRWLASLGRLTVSYNTIQHNTMLCNIIQHNTIYNTTQYNTTRHNTVITVDCVVSSCIVYSQLYSPQAGICHNATALWLPRQLEATDMRSFAQLHLLIQCDPVFKVKHSRVHVQWPHFLHFPSVRPWNIHYSPPRSNPHALSDAGAEESPPNAAARIDFEHWRVHVPKHIRDSPLHEKSMWLQKWLPPPKLKQRW